VTGIPRFYGSAWCYRRRRHFVVGI